VDGGDGSAEPVQLGRRLQPAGKNWTDAPVGLPGVGEGCMLERNSGERGKVSEPSQDAPVWQGHPYNRTTRKSGGGAETGS
jgi:hypothetical protein